MRQRTRCRGRYRRLHGEEIMNEALENFRAKCAMRAAQPRRLFDYNLKKRG
ncbi:hypothetical protein C4K37_0764 [Pseudomonas chlororaphis subsp. piscium]|nr:hypothetical protein C4K37_0764 [Pseudomonas chlororaphis subsp. piscium]AZC41714.1 hypothetical protein C4K36_0767 [Pseudomonas chlororaphis subsp. piscium]